MSNAENKAFSIRGIKKFTAATVADRMSYWMRKSPQELMEATEDSTLSTLDMICINSLLSDVRYGKMKNLDLMLSRIVGTPVSQLNVNQTVSNVKPVKVELVGIEVGNEDSLKALEDLKEKSDGQ